MSDETKRERDIQLIPHEGPRVETGAVQFGDDWPGLFIRGDNAFALAMHIDAIERALKGDSDEFERTYAMTNLASIRDIIRGNVILCGPDGCDA